MEVQDPLKSPAPPPSSPPQGQDHEAAGATALMDEDKQRPAQGQGHEASGATALMDEYKQRPPQGQDHEAAGATALMDEDKQRPPQGQDHEAAGATALMDEDKQRPPQGQDHEAGATALVDEDKQRNTSTNNIHELSDEAYDVIRETTNEYEELIPNEYEELVTNENKGNMSLGNEGLETNENEESVTIENEEPVTNESKDRRKSKIALRSSPKPKAMIRIFLWRMHTFFQKVIIRCVKIAPVIIGFIVFCLMIFDQGTDINSTRQICTVQCKCVWKNATKECEGPGDARRNGDECYAAFGNKDLIQNYCGSAKNKTACDGADGLLTWRPGNLRHPKYCGFSATTILLPNLVNSIYLLYSLWCIRSEVSDYTRIPNNVLSKIIFLIIFIAQLFPHTWVFMSF
ncbi:unnamed protein product [Meganyctiphanes norvegica]|uniref:Uncharacterized protein n=1 Tax=Meganyctiphanes norvegica TaxID=48144 RepID=A0AAV2S135_MEGNR